MRKNIQSLWGKQLKVNFKDYHSGTFLALKIISKVKSIINKSFFKEILFRLCLLFQKISFMDFSTSLIQHKLMK